MMYVASATASRARSDDEAIPLCIGRRSDSIDPSRRHPEGRWGLWTISASVVVEDGQASSSSSCLDLASQAPSAYIIVFMNQNTKQDPTTNYVKMSLCATL